MSAKIPAPDFPKIKIFWNKGYEVIIYVHDINNKVLSRYSNHIVDAAM